jgi:hypothetical protein
MLKYLLYALGLYLLYKLIFGFIIPVYRTTKQVKKQFRDMRSRMEAHLHGEQHEEGGVRYDPPPASKPEPKPNKKDYIDFEEVK